MYSLQHTLEPTYSGGSLPVSVAELKLHSRFETTGATEDALIEGYLMAATIRAERLMSRSLIEHKYKLTLDWFPYLVDGRGLVCAAPIELPRPPVKSVESVKYLDLESVQQTMVVTDDYLVHLESLPPRIVPAYGKTWPTAQNYFKAVEVAYTTGYAAVSGGAGPGALPADIKQAIRLMAASWYETRESMAHRSMEELPIPLAASAIFAHYRVRKIA